jgi:uncharacterized protein YydD (DUF2326 family)
MKLISMTDFVLQENKGGQQVNSISSQLHQDLRRIKKYANFLKQPLNLEMFNESSSYDYLFEDVFLSEDGEIYSNGNQILQFESGCFFDRDSFFNDELEITTIEGLINYKMKLNNATVKRIFG